MESHGAADEVCTPASADEVLAAFQQPRLAPMGNTFVNQKEVCQEEIPVIVRRRRSVTLKAHSIPDYIPHNLREMYGESEICDLATGSQSGKDSKSPSQAPESTHCDDNNSHSCDDLEDASPYVGGEGLDTDSELERRPTSPHAAALAAPISAAVVSQMNFPVPAAEQVAQPGSAALAVEGEQQAVEAQQGEKRRGRRSRQRRPSQQNDAEGDPTSPRNESIPLDAASGPITTLMVRNLPHDLIQSDLASEIDQCGFKGLYDFLYMPSTFGTGRGKGYAFVNFVNPEVAQNFATMWQNSCRFGQVSERSQLNVSAACLQGRDANVARWDTSKMRRIRNPNHRPLVAVLMADQATSSATASNPPSPSRVQGQPAAQTPMLMAPAPPPTPTLSTDAPHSPAQAVAGFQMDMAVRQVQHVAEGQNLVGRWCKLCNLTRTPQANGLWGAVEAYEAPTGRYIVRVAADNDHWFMAKLLRENLDVPPMGSR